MWFQEMPFNYMDRTFLSELLYLNLYKYFIVMFYPENKTQAILFTKSTIPLNAYTFFPVGTADVTTSPTSEEPPHFSTECLSRVVTCIN